MNFTFLIILSLLTLGFTYETLKISQKQLTIIILVLLILLVSYNVKETFQTQTTSADNISEDSDEESKKFFLFNGSLIQHIRDYFSKDRSKETENHLKIDREMMNIKI